MRHIPSRVSHPQSNGKVERFFGTVKAKLPRFLGDVDGLVRWDNFVRPHMSLTELGRDRDAAPSLRQEDAEGGDRDGRRGGRGVPY